MGRPLVSENVFGEPFSGYLSADEQETVLETVRALDDLSALFEKLQRRFFAVAFATAVVTAVRQR